ncbi:MAG: ABC transporter permease [Lachnospiraceae bacterium]|nr:ABC transporter permease [Lachnospiraceae bacterium]
MSDLNNKAPAPEKLPASPAPTAEKKVREPLFHIVKRAGIPRLKAWGIRAVAILLALLLNALIIHWLTGLDPLAVYKSMFDGSFSTSRKFWVLLQNTAMLLCIALAVTPCYKMRFWNLGAEGQVLIGALSSGALMFYVGDKLPSGVLIALMLGAALLSGILWAGIPALFKARFGTNETLFTLMMNYVAIQLVNTMIAIWVPSGSGVLGIMNSRTNNGWLPTVFGQKYALNIIIVSLLTVFMFIYLKYSKHGYEIAVVGESENTARYIGINVRKVVIRTAALSGCIAGLAGFLLMAGSAHTVSNTIAGGNGFTAVLVSWLAKFNPFVMILTSLLIEFLQKGAGEIAQAFRLSSDIADIATGIILFFIIGCEFFLNYRIMFRHKAQKEGK